jgi:TP901 family phage tail tape measure protein
MANETTLKLKADISSLKAQMQAASRQVRLANSEFKAASAGMKDWASNADGLEAKVKQLTSILKAQKTQVELAREEWERTKEAYGENSAEADRAKIKLNNLEAAVKKTESQLSTYEQDLKDCREGTGKFSDEIDESGTSMQNAEKDVKNLDEGFTTMKGVMADLVASGIKVVISGLKDMASYAKEAFEEFDAAEDNMIAKTGATGEKLEGLRDTYVNVSKDIVADSNDISNAIGEISTKFGLSGDELQSFSEKMLKFSQLNNTDVSTSIDNVYSAMTAWGISMEDADSFLDLLNMTGQKTGASVDKLTSSLTTNAASLKDMGFSVDEATTFLGKLELAGVDADTVMQGLKKALANSAKEGTSTKDALAELQATMAATTSDSEKTVAAMELFGSKAGPAIAEACSSGRLNFEDLGNAMTDYEGNLDKTYDATLDASDKIKLTFQGMKAEAGQYIAEMLDESGEDIDELLNLVKSSFKDIMTAVKENAPAIRDTIKGVITFFTKLLTGLINNFGDIMSIVKAVGTVLIATFAVTKIASFISTIVGLVKTFQTLKTATEGATTAQQLLNAAQNANVIGAITAAVAGLAAAVLWLISTDDEYKEQLPTLTEEEQKHVDAINEMASAYQDMEAQRKETINGIQEEFGHYSELKEELETLVDENGKVKEGYEDRAAFIVSTLNEALGTEIQMTDGVIQNYQEEMDALDALMEKKKAQAVLTASEEAYTEAVKNSNQALKEMTEADKIYRQNIEEKNKLQAEQNKLSNMSAEEYAKLNGIENDLGAAERARIRDLSNLQDQINATNGAIGESHVAYDKAKSTYESYQATIKNYEGLSAAIISGDTTQINNAMNDMVYNFQTAETANRETLEKQVEDYEANAEMLEQAIRDKTPGVTREMVDQAKEMVNKANAELDKAPPEAASRGEKYGKQYGDSVGSESNKANVDNKAGSLVTTADNAVQPDGSEVTAGNNFAEGFAGGISALAGQVQSAAQGIGKDATNALNNGIDAHSPSQATTTSGENFGQGFINGMNNKTNDVWNTAFGLAKKALEALKKGQQEGSPSKLTARSGFFFVEGFRGAIVKGTSSVVKAAAQMAIETTKALSEVEFDGTSLKKTFATGVSSMVNGLTGELNTGSINLNVPRLPSLATNTGNVSNTTVINNTYEMNQNNYSPKNINALKAYQYGKQQMEFLKAQIRRR